MTARLAAPTTFLPRKLQHRQRAPQVDHRIDAAAKKVRRLHRGTLRNQTRLELNSWELAIANHPEKLASMRVAEVLQGRLCTEFHVIDGQDGKPAFVIVPYDQFRRMKGGFTHGTVPNEVVNLSFERGVSAMAAWREHFGLTQAEVAGRIGIAQAACAQMERVKQPRKVTLEKVAAALGLEVE